MTMRFQMPVAFAIGAFSSSTGNIRPGDRLRFYNTGGLTPRSIYSDTALATPITQPLVADSAGRFVNDGNGNAVNDIFLQSGLYKLVWSTSADVEIHAFDNVDPGLATGGTGGILAVVDGGTGASTAGGALANLGAASQAGLDTEISARQSTDARVTVLETASAFITPGGRLTLTTAVPVLTSDVIEATTVYYTPYLHNRVPLWDGSQWTLAEVDEVSQTLADTTKSPAGAATNSAYDMFVWNDAGTVRCTRGPAWSNVTTRGTGAGTTELERIDGFHTNKQNITNGPLANRGLYVGTICTNGSTQLAMMFKPSAAAGGSANRLDVWNMFNRVDVAATLRDSTNSWEYTTATIRAANAAAGSGVGNRINIVVGLQEDVVDAEYGVPAGNNVPVRHAVLIGIDSTTEMVAGCRPGVGNTAFDFLVARYVGFCGIGSHYIQALEYSTASGTTTWLGDNNSPTIEQMALQVRLRM